MISAGIDIAKSRDHTAVAFMDGMRITGAYRIQNQISWSDIIDSVVRLIRSNQASIIAVDVTGVGSPVLERIMESYPNAKYMPIHFNALNKSDMLLSLLTDIRSGNVKMSFTANGATDLIAELANMKVSPSHTRRVYRISGKGRGGTDDLVIACALALLAQNSLNATYMRPSQQ